MREINESRFTLPLVIVSGIPAGDSGTGRLVAHLQERIFELAGKRIKLVSRPERPALWQIQLWLRNKAYRNCMRELLRYILLLARFWYGLSCVWVNNNHKLILLHPQNLGYRLALQLLESRKHASLIYLLDSSFFCIASYNHLKGDNSSCLRCIEHGFDQVAKNECKPFPLLDWTALKFAPRLLELVGSGRVNVAAQSRRQAELAQRHFGLKDLPRVIGLWTQDWDELFSEWVNLSSNTVPTAYSWDVLFHGHCVDAKGASWTAKVAELSPEIRFMFPFSKPDWFAAPANCSFRPCTWESGLYDEIKKSRFVIVPSLWSAPIEGALVKSIVCANAVVVVDNRTSFCDELPEGVVLKLSADPMTGAEELKRACASNWSPNTDVRAQWINEFALKKINFVSDLIEAALVVQ
ncbi:hypothetical protein [Methylomonas sp. MK1]|uniref:hypothetical protein n=1 Tax=Methylomonas sp. MK1 TaxID=1131552 RepID=UPI00036DC1BB|nr:hypothetical protein [Methylomonas sp. MK1]